MSPSDQFHWMLQHGDKLAEAIKNAGGMHGDEVDKLLDEAQKLDSTGKTKQKARLLLKQKLEHRGVGHLFEL